MDKTTTRTHLRSMAGIDAHYGASLFLGFVLQKATQLREAPGVYTPTGFPASLFGSLADVHKVLDNDGRSGFYALNNTPTDNVVAVQAEAVYLSSKPLQVPLTGFCAFALEFALQSKVSSIDFLPPFFTMKSLIRTNGRTGEAKIDSDSLAVRNKLNIRDGQNDMQEEPALAIDEIGGVKSSRSVHPTLGMLIHPKGNNLPTGYGSKANSIREHSVGSCVVANRYVSACWTGYFLALLLKCKSRLNRFGGLYSRSADQLRRKLRKQFPERIIRFFVQSHAVLDVLLESKPRDYIEALRVLLHCIKQYFGLLNGRIQLQANGSLHTHILTHFTEIYNKGGVGFPPHGQSRGYPADNI